MFTRYSIPVAHFCTCRFARFVVRPQFIYNSSFLIRQCKQLQPTILKTANTERVETRSVFPGTINPSRT